VGRLLTKIFNQSMLQGKLPESWLVAKVIPLEKAGKDDWTDVRSYRPISMLCTISRVLERVINSRLQWFNTTFGLIVDNQFGFQPGKSTEQSTAIMVKNVQEAWKNDREASFLFLDVKGAYDTVIPSVLLKELARLRLPMILINWIGSYLSNRKAVWVVEGENSDVMDVSIGLPQGSALSPTLYLYYNAVILERKGDKGFADDVVFAELEGDIGVNTSRLQKRIEIAQKGWCGSHNQTLDFKKFQLIHFTRSKDFETVKKFAIQWDNLRIEPREVVNDLGVWLDYRLTFDHHLEQMERKAARNLGAIRGLVAKIGNIKPEHYVNLLKSTVINTLLYNAVVWGPSVNWKKRTQFDSLLADGAKSSIGLFKKTAMKTSLLETGLKPFELMVQERIAITVTKWGRLPQNHAIHGLIPAAGGPGSRIQPPVYAPWENLFNRNMKVIILDSKKEAIDYWNFMGKQVEVTQIYVDGSKGDTGCGAAMLSIGQNGKTWRKFRYGMDTSIRRLEENILYEALCWMENEEDEEFIIWSDAQAVVKEVGSRDSNDETIHLIQEKLQKLSETKKISLVWIPAHAGIEGNEEVDLAAKEAARNDQLEMKFLSWKWKEQRQRIILDSNSRWMEEAKKSTVKSLKDIPSLDGWELYKKMSFEEAKQIARLRTNHVPLNQYLARCKIEQSAECICGHAEESREHFLLECPMWTDQRKRLQKKLMDKNIKRLSVNRMLSSPRQVKYVCQYVKETKRFDRKWKSISMKLKK